MGHERVSGKFRGLAWDPWSPQPCENWAGLQNGRGMGNQDERSSRIGVTSQLCSSLAVCSGKATGSQGPHLQNRVRVWSTSQVAVRINWEATCVTHNTSDVEQTADVLTIIMLVMRKTLPGVTAIVKGLDIHNT